jgi:hypothetical protein
MQCHIFNSIIEVNNHILIETNNMKKILLLLLTATSLLTQAQTKIGINNTNPQAALDVQGDLRLRSALLNIPYGVNDNVDITTTKSSVYMFAGAALDGCQITGFTGGVDGRMVTIFNNCPLNTDITLYDETRLPNLSTASNRIVTGNYKPAVIHANGSLTLRYDGGKLRWTIVGFNNTDGIKATPNPWNKTGNDINNTNTGNVGIGTITPQAKLDIIGSIKIADGTQGAGKVLTSNAAGKATWESPAAPINGYAGFGVWGDCVTNTKVTDYNPVSPDDSVSEFGRSVSLYGNYAALGTDSDAVYIYKFDTTSNVWNFYQKIHATTNGIGFGRAVALYNDYLIVGAEKDGPISQQGSASIYKNIAGVWTFQIKLYNVNGQPNDFFGFSVAIDGDNVIIGAPYDDDAAGIDQGSVCIFRNIAGVWTFQAKLFRTNAQSNEGFGYGVSISNDYAIVGAPFVNYGVSNTNSGEASIYKKVNGVWVFNSSHTPNISIPNTYNYGASVGIKGNYALVGNTGVNPIIASSSLAGYLFLRLLPAGWTYSGQSTISGFLPFVGFTTSVAISENYSIIGDWVDKNVEINNASLSKPIFGFGCAVAIDPTSNRFLIGSLSNQAVFGKVK